MHRHAQYIDYTIEIFIGRKTPSCEFQDVFAKLAEYSIKSEIITPYNTIDEQTPINFGTLIHTFFWKKFVLIFSCS